MENRDTSPHPVLGFDELFDDSVIVDGTGADLEEIDKIMKGFFSTLL